MSSTSNKVGSEFGEPHKFDPDFRGPVKNRSCTDVLCCLLFGIFVAGWCAVVVIAVIRGEPSRLLYPTDSKGRICGKDESVVDKPFLFFFDITRCASPKVPFTGCPTPQICVKKCPSESWFYSPGSTVNEMYCKENVDVSSNEVNLFNLIVNHDCAGYYINSKSVAGRCIPQIGLNASTEFLKDSAGRTIETVGDNKITRFALNKSIKLLAVFLKSKEFVNEVAEDIINTRYFLLVGCCLAMVVSLIWIVLLRLIARVMIWFSLIAFTGISGFAAYYTMQKYLTSRGTEDVKISLNITNEIFAEAMENVDAPSRRTLWLVAFIVTIIIFLICFIVLIFLRKRVSIAIALINEASKAVGSIMSTLLFPIVPFIFHLLVLVIFCGTTFMLAAGGNPEYRIMCDSPTNNCSSCASSIQENSTCDPDSFKVIQCPNEIQLSCQFFSHMADPETPYLHLFNVFMFLWTMFFVSAFAEFVLAGAFASWYWSFDKRKDLPPLPITKSIGVALRYHIGTIAFGSLIIAIVRGIRMIFEYIDYKVKQYTDSVVVKVLSCCCRCCLWCLEKFLRFVNRNAYIYCAIYGTNFCKSARKSFSLLMRNILRVVTVDLVTDFLLLIGKLVVTGLMAIFTFLLFGGSIPVLSQHLEPLNYPLTPVILITVATFFIASSFFNVYEMAVDTLFFCFLEDNERNDGSPAKPFFMSKELMGILNKSNKFQKSE